MAAALVAVALSSLAVLGGGSARPAAAALSPPPQSVAPGTGRALDFPSGLSTPEPSSRQRLRLSTLTSGVDGPAVTTCARKCLPGCMKGGKGGPGLGPASLRRDPVVFGAGFRDRATCLRECTEVCAVKVSQGGVK